MADIAAMLDSFFRISERGSDIKTEFKGGLITFLAMVYILTVNPYILMDGAGSYANFAPLFTATCLATIFACILMALYARFPVALAPGMGINAFLAYTICLTLGFSFPQALMAVFVSGVLFLVLSVTKVREMIINSIPASFRYAITAGIGFFIAYIGLVNAGIIDNTAQLSIGSTTLVPKLGTLGEPAIFLGIIAIIVTLVLYYLKPWVAAIGGILVSLIIGLLFGIIEVPSECVLSPDFGFAGIVFSDFEMFNAKLWPAFIVAILSLLIVDIFDTTGTLLAVGGSAGLINDDNELQGGSKALLVDSVATIAGAALGTSTTTSYVESTSGIAAGARTGLMALVVALLFVVALFFSPVFGMITSACLAGVLVLVGVMMLSSLKNIDWEDSVWVATAFMTIFVMGLSYSISNGIGFGVITYIIGMAATKRMKEVNKVMLGIGVAFVVYFVLIYGVLPML